MEKRNSKKSNLKIFFAYLKNYKKAVILAPLFMILEVIMDLLQPKLLSKIVDEGIIKRNSQIILNTGLVMFLVAIIGLIGGIGCTIFSSLASQNLGYDLRKKLFRKILISEFENINKFSPASLITRLTNDISQVQQLALISLRMFVRAPFLCLGGIIMAFSINLKLSLIIFIIVPALVFTFWYFSKKGFSLFSIMQKKLDRLNLLIRENLAGIRVIRIFNRTSYEKERFENASNELMFASLNALNFIVKMGPIIMAIINLSLITVLWFGAKMYINNQIKIGEVIAFVNYLMIILISLTMISNLFIFISRAIPSIERINEIFGIPEQKKEKKEKYSSFLFKGEIEFKNVFFSYDGKLENSLLKNISFKIEKGETVGIIGATGSGKTTLLNLIVGLYQPTLGEIYISGKNIKDVDPEIIKKNIGFITQESLIFSGTIREIMKWANQEATDEEIIFALKISQIYDFIKTLPDGLDTYIGQKGINLSGGQKQRLTIARAIVKKPEILILDDCTSSIDFITEKKIFEELRKKLKDITKVVVTSRIFTIINADKILVLENGEIAGIGTHFQLLENCEVYREIYEIQKGEKIDV
ncbi:MAG: ABC transporter ATP-binding protein/permease [Candidatus Omnitrophica bacterium]|nr:ABC transporter ATP-binding protein/permease [Candidatus Omnitrophota bacterium]